MTKLCPDVFDERVNHISELFSMVRDGLLYPVDEVFVPIDAAPSIALRARAFSAHRPGTSIAHRQSASWILGTRYRPPQRPQVCLDPTRRARLPSRFVVAQYPIDESEILHVADVRLTTPLRTALDLIVAEPHFDTAIAAEVLRLLDLSATTITHLTQAIETSHRSGVRCARERVTTLTALTESEAYPSLTR